MILLPHTDRFTTEPPEPGIYFDVPASKYHKWRAASKSLLNEIASDQCATDAHIRWHLYNNKESTNALADGAAYDCLLFEPERFEAEYVIVPKMTRKGKEWDSTLQSVGGDASRIIWEEDDADNPQRLDAVRLRGMHAALKAHSRRRHCLACPGAKVQVTIVFDDPVTGLRCKTRPDRLLPNHVLLDAKTVRTAARVPFGYDCFDYGYDMQAAMGVMGYKAATGNDAHFLFLIQEKHGQFQSAIRVATSELELPNLVQCGAVRFRDTVDKLVGAMTRGTWLGFPDIEEPVFVPPNRIPEGVTA